nr:MAG TPA: hypothetical protein [Caudoviricetes sp.]
MQIILLLHSCVISSKILKEHFVFLSFPPSQDCIKKATRFHSDGSWLMIKFYPIIIHHFRY